MSHYTTLSKYGDCTRLLKVKNKLKSVVSSVSLFVGVLNKKKIVPLGIVEYEMIVANSYSTRTRGIIEDRA